MITRYVAGFAFSKDASKVALIRKKRPAWQAGKLNAIGGHVEEEDTSLAIAQIREYKEETGVQSTLKDWHKFAVLGGVDFEVTFFYSTNEDLLDVTTTTDEFVSVYDWPANSGDLMHNLVWLIEAARDNILNPGQKVFLRVDM